MDNVDFLFHLYFNVLDAPGRVGSKQGELKKNWIILNIGIATYNIIRFIFLRMHYNFFRRIRGR